MNSKQDAGKEDFNEDSGHESVSDNEEDEKDESSPCITSYPTKTSALLGTVSGNDSGEANNEDGEIPSCMSSKSTITSVVPIAVSDNDDEEKYDGSSPCMSSQSTKTSAVQSLASISVDLKNRSPAANDCDTKPGNGIPGDKDEEDGEKKDSAAAVEGDMEQSMAAVIEDTGEESDEDNESVVFPDVGLKTSATGAVRRFSLSTPADDVVYQERGPSKVPRPHSVSSRYNPMVSYVLYCL